MDGHFLARYETIRASWFHYGLMTQSTTYRVRMPHDGDTVIGNRCSRNAKKRTVMNSGDGLRRRRRCSPWHVLLKRTPFRHFHSTLFLIDSYFFLAHFFLLCFWFHFYLPAYQAIDKEASCRQVFFPFVIVHVCSGTSCQVCIF